MSGSLTGCRWNSEPDWWWAEGALHSPTLTGPPSPPGNLETASKEYFAPCEEEHKIEWERETWKGNAQVVQLHVRRSSVCAEAGMSGCRGVMGRFWLRMLQALTNSIQVCSRLKARLVRARACMKAPLAAFETLCKCLRFMPASYLRQGTLPPSELLLLVDGCEGGPLIWGEAPGVGWADVCSPPPPPPSGDSVSFSSYCIRTSSSCKHTDVHAATLRGDINKPVSPGWKENQRFEQKISVWCVGRLKVKEVLRNPPSGSPLCNVRLRKLLSSHEMLISSCLLHPVSLISLTDMWEWRGISALLQFDSLPSLLQI